jgi:hypothetical protein
MAEDRRMTAAQVVDKLIGSEHADVVCESVAWVVAELMEAEVAGQIGAELGEVSGERVTQRNGYRPRPWDTRAGEIELQIPKLRQGRRCSPARRHASLAAGFARALGASAGLWLRPLFAAAALPGRPRTDVRGRRRDRDGRASETATRTTSGSSAAATSPKRITLVSPGRERSHTHQGEERGQQGGARPQRRLRSNISPTILGYTTNRYLTSSVRGPYVPADTAGVASRTSRGVGRQSAARGRRPPCERRHRPDRPRGRVRMPHVR